MFLTNHCWRQALLRVFAELENSLRVPVIYLLKISLAQDPAFEFLQKRRSEIERIVRRKQDAVRAERHDGRRQRHRRDVAACRDSLRFRCGVLKENGTRIFTE
jgi:hypothetical protein